MANQLMNSAMDHSLNTSKEGQKRKTFQDFELVEIETELGNSSELGKGTYGVVRLVRDKTSKSLFAMKIVTPLFIETSLDEETTHS